jgi:GNAT superfamily N-acetyltransferase
MSSSLPEGATMRALTPADAEAAAALWREVEASHGLRQGATASELLEWWSYGDLAANSWVLEAGGLLLAFAWLDSHGDAADVGMVVQPEARGGALETLLVELTEQRARELGEAAIRQHAYAVDEARRRLLEERGYRPARHFYEMVVELDAVPPAPEWPDGIRPRPFRVEDARPFFDALGEAFEDEWGFVSIPYDEWYRRRVEEGDTSLLFLAWDGGELAGVARCEAERRGMGWVGALGVRPRWRRRGLGRALLLHAFGEFQRRGVRRVGLGVDASNPTGATALYESAGMSVTLEDVVYELPLGS